MNLKKTILFFTFFLIALSFNLYSQDEFKNKGFFNITQVSYVKNFQAFEFVLLEDIEVPGWIFYGKVELDANKAFAYSFNTIFGYYIFPKHLSIGIGLGLEKNYKPDFNLMPLFIDVRMYFGKKKKWSQGDVPFIYWEFGEYLKLNEQFEKGHMSKFGVGYRFMLSEKICMTTDLALSHKKVPVNLITEWDSVEITGISFSVGFVF